MKFVQPRMSLARSVQVLIIVAFAAASARADFMTRVDPNEKSPSKDQILWTETNWGYDVESEYDYVGGAPVNFNNGRTGDVEEHYTDIRNIVTHRWLMAFLFHGGFNWERLGFDPGDILPVPDQLSSLNAILGFDFRWSSRSLLHVQVEPGFYSDLSEFDGHYMDTPVSIGYMHVVSYDLQWALGLSIDTWRENRYLPGGGFRYALSDRWKLKFMLPNPQIEYKANDYVHLWLGSDFRGGSYRVARDFGTLHGLPQLNDSLVDYQEVRVGTGFSWNIKRLIELNGEAGWLVDRSFNYHNAGIQTSQNGGAPYVSLNLRMLFEMAKDARPIKDQVRSMEYQFPSLLRFFKVPQ